MKMNCCSYQHLSIGNNSDRDEEKSSEDDVKEHFNKSLLLDKFQQLLNQLAEESNTKTR